MPQGSKYKNQRKPNTPPHVSIKAVRQRLGFSLDYVVKGIESRTGQSHSKGTLSAVENGHRGVSADYLSHLESIYGLEAGSITTDYKPTR